MLLKYILPHLSESETIADVFMGGGSVSLACKWQGHRVIANDIAYRSRVIAESLIVNDSVRLTDEDIYSLFTPGETDSHFIERNLSKFFTEDSFLFLDRAFANARARMSPKKELLELLLYKFIIGQRQFGGFGHNEDQQMIAKGATSELLEKSSASRAVKVKRMLSHPLPILFQIQEQINRAVCRTPFQNEFCHMDCFAFLENMQSEGKKIDAAYFDSPYKSSITYSSHYAVLDQILEGRMNVDIDDKAFNRSDALENFRKLFSLAQFIPKWVISMGYNPKSENGIRGEELLRVVEVFKPAKLFSLAHRWTINNITATKSTPGKRQEENVEYLIVTE